MKTHLKTLFIVILSISLTACLANQGGYDPYSTGGYGNSGGYNSDPYYGEDYRVRRDRERAYREQQRIERERLELERERLQLERDRHNANRPIYSPSGPSTIHQPQPKRDRCPAGFSPSERKCNDKERRKGCRDMRTPGGMGCVSGR